MTISNILLIILWLFIIPILLGFGILRFDFKYRNQNILFAFILGYIVEWFTFQIIAIPCSYFQTTFMLVKNIWFVTIVVLTVISLLLNIKKFKEIIAVNFEELKKYPKILTALLLIIILIQCIIQSKVMYLDPDDSTFLAMSTTAVDTNSICKYDDAGIEYTEIPTRTFLSPFPYWNATISVLTNLRPIVLCHSVLPITMLILAYSLYLLIGLSLFKNDKVKAVEFMLILILVYIFSGYSRYSIMLRLFVRIWQGKNIIANILIPLVIYMFLEFIGKKNDFYYWLLLMFILWAGCLPSTMGIYLLPIEGGILTLIYMIKNRKFSYLFKFLLSCIPVIGYIVFYLTKLV